jgi:phosphonate transport system substrate-binding protein
MFIKSAKRLFLQPALLLIAPLLLALAFFPLSGCEKEAAGYEAQYSNSTPPKQPLYLFGVHPLHNPKHLFEVYGPLVQYINARLNNAQLKLEASRNYAAYDSKLFNRHFDFALPNPYQTVTAVHYGYHIFGKMGDDDNFRGIILVRKDSGIENVTDLKGKAVSYPAETALAATMMPQWYLHTHGLDINRDITNLYVGSQESSIMNVYLGKVAAAATWPPPWKAFIKERPQVAEDVEVKWQTDPLPNNGLVARDDMPASLVKQVADILFSLHESPEGRAILARMELSRFEAADDATYAPVRDFLNQFEQQVRPTRSSQ